MTRSSSTPYLYYRTQELVFSLQEMPVQVVSKPGIPHWNEITPAMVLLSEAVELKPGDWVLMLGCSHGALCAHLALRFPESFFWAVDTNSIAMQMTGETIQRNDLKNVKLVPDITILPEEAGRFDVVVMELPKGRKLARRWLMEGYEALREGGHFYLAGPNQEGIQPVIQDAQELFGNAVVKGYKKGNRVARMVKKETQVDEVSWSQEAGILPGSWYPFAAEIRGMHFLLKSLPGIFSFDHIDEGTHLLLDQLEITPGSRVLDMGCGYGLIGLMAARLGAGWVDMVDSSLLAVAAAKENLRDNNIQMAKAFAGDILSWVRNERYDYILSNPPFHSGKEVVYDISQAFIQQSRDILRPGGKLILVANAFIRYDRLIGQIFGNVSSPVKTSKYHILCGIHNPSRI